MLLVMLTASCVTSDYSYSWFSKHVLALEDLLLHHFLTRPQRKRVRVLVRTGIVPGSLRFKDGIGNLARYFRPGVYHQRVGQSPKGSITKGCHGRGRAPITAAGKGKGKEKGVMLVWEHNDTRGGRRGGNDFRIGGLVKG